jgi:hypothetical protein
MDNTEKKFSMISLAISFQALLDINKFVCYHNTKNHLPILENKNMSKHVQNETLQLAFSETIEVFYTDGNGFMVHPKKISSILDNWYLYKFFEESICSR